MLERNGILLLGSGKKRGTSPVRGGGKEKYLSEKKLCAEGVAIVKDVLGRGGATSWRRVHFFWGGVKRQGVSSVSLAGGEYQSSPFLPEGIRS